jgi:hypothetical protein
MTEIDWLVFLWIAMGWAAWGRCVIKAPSWHFATIGTTLLTIAMLFPAALAGPVALIIEIGDE